VEYLSKSNVKEDVYEATHVVEDFTGAELRLAVNAVHEGDRDFFNCVPHVLGPRDDLHLEHVPARLDRRDDLLNH